MEIAIDRRSDDAARVPFERPIELAHPELHGPFEAKGVDLSPGGLAARATCLPQVGARLRCRMPGPSDDESLQTQAEVAWVQVDGPRRGQFGMRFVDLDVQTRGKITRMVGEPAGQSTASNVHLMLEGMKRPVEARVVGHDEDAVVVEQDLPLLQRGRRISIGDGHASAWQGCIRGVELKLDDGMPRLTVTVATQPASASPAEPEPARDEPSDPRTVALDATADQLLTSPLPSEQVALDEPEVAVEQPAVASAAPSGEPSRAEVKPGVESPAVSDGVPAEAPAMRVPERDPFQSTAAPAGQGNTAAPSVLAARVRARLASFWQGLLLGLRRALGPFHARMKRSRARLRTSSVPVAWGALRRMTVTRSRRNRKGQVGHANQRRKPAGVPAEWLRTLALGVTTFVGVALAVYALSAPDSEGNREPAPRAEADSAAETSADRARPREAKPAPAADEEHAAGATAKEKASAAEKPAESSDAPSFGVERVPNGRTYTLRMTDPVEDLKGVSDDSGFTVQIPGSLSLDRAGPMAAAHPAVRRSMVLNRGDHSELTIRFADGVQPLYRVRGKGASLEIEIEVP